MIPEAGAFELIFLAMVALIVVGPKDLPILLRKVGQFTAKMRGLAAEFRSSFDEMARQSELDELRKEVEALRDGRFGDAARPDLESHVREIDHLMTGPMPTAPAPMEAMWSPPENSGFHEGLGEAAAGLGAEVEPELPFDAPPPPVPAAPQIEAKA